MTEINLFPKFIDKAASPVAEKVGVTLSSVWDIVFGGVDLYAKKMDYKREQAFNDFKITLDEKVSSVPSEKLVEPDLHIIGPTLEASKYYFENETLREMFANLLASSMNIDLKNKTHPSFVEIIKQLSSLDAGVLANFKDFNQIAIVQLRVVKPSGEYIDVLEHIMNFNDQDIYKSHVTSLSNLQRLGLLNISYSRHSPRVNEYDFVKGHPAYQETHQELLEIQKTDPLFNEVFIQKGLCSTTPLCKDFIQICL